MKYFLRDDKNNNRNWLLAAVLAVVFAVTILFVLWLVLIRAPAVG